MVTVFLSLGSNAGQPMRNMEEMLRHVRQVIAPVSASRLMETEPLETAEEQQWYLNRVVSGPFAGTPRDLLQACMLIEEKLGRVRAYRHSPRTADIDILLFGDAVVREKDLCIPHPGLLGRRFCLEGVRELMPACIIPGAGNVSLYCQSMDASIARQQIKFLG
jgi:2-amino-4-hydroxy-6-hydroxymethyldihydropteridine diphosphokinase